MMNLSADLNIGKNKNFFAELGFAIELCISILLCFFSLTISNVHAEAATDIAPTAISATAISETSAHIANTDEAKAPTTAINSPINMHKPALAEPQKISSSSQLANLIGGLILILGLIYGLSWFVKRFSQGGFLKNTTIKMLSTMPLGTRERIMLVDVGGKHILLGITATHINALHVFEEPVVTAESVAPVASEFSQKLMAIIQQKNPDPAKKYEQ